MDFFGSRCQSGPFTEVQFGVCDHQAGLPAYVDTQDTSKWIATVQNPKQTPVTFTAIDKCVIGDDEEPGHGRCDGMLTTDTLLYLVELKDKTPPWQQEAIGQLESTIKFLHQHHETELKKFRHKKAFACNRKHSRFVVITHEEQRSFYERNKFRLDIQATVSLE